MFKLIELAGWYKDAQERPREAIKRLYPDAINAVNGSLYDGKIPCGIVVCNGKEKVSDWAIGVLGFGVRTDGTADFGYYAPGKWTDFTTGYIGLVQAGKKVDLTKMSDKYVRDSVNPRTVIYRKAGTVYMRCFPACTLYELQNFLLLMGVADAINMDGGGSCHLLYNGVTDKQYTTKRQVVNAWIETGPKRDLAHEHPRLLLNASKARLPVYETTDRAKQIGSLDPSEIVDCSGVYPATDGTFWVMVSYTLTANPGVRKAGFVAGGVLFD